MHICTRILFPNELINQLFWCQLTTTRTFAILFRQKHFNIYIMCYKYIILLYAIVTKAHSNASMLVCLDLHVVALRYSCLPVLSGWLITLITLRYAMFSWYFLVEDVICHYSYTLWMESLSPIIGLNLSCDWMVRCHIWGYKADRSWYQNYYNSSIELSCIVVLYWQS